MKISGRNINLISIILFSIFLLLSCNSNRFRKTSYRLISEKHYVSNDFSIPEIINDSTARCDFEITYNYNGNDLVSVNKKTRDIFKENESFNECSYDSITYINNDSVYVKRKMKENSFSFYSKNKDYFKSLVNNDLIRRCNSDDCKLIKRSENHYILSYGEPNRIWCCDFHYYLNKNGYVIKYGIESDTNASITIYEYEQGYNRFNLYYTFSDKNSGNL